MADKNSKNNSKTSHESKDELSSINLNSINTYQKNQLNIFLTKEIQRIVNLTNESYEQRLLETNKNINEFKNKITEQMSTVSGIQNEMYNCFKINKNNFQKLSNIQNIMMSIEERIENNKSNIENLRNEISEIDKKYEKYINENLVVPNNINEKENINNIKDFFQYLVNEIKNIKTEIKNKEIKMSSCKTELNKIIKQIKKYIETFNESNKNYIKQNYDDFNKIFYEKLDKINEEIPKLDFSNSIYAKDLKQEIIDVIKERKDLELYQKNLEEKFNNYFQSLSTKAEESINEIFKYRKEFTKIKKYFIDIIEFLKDVRFQRNINNNENNKNYVEKLIFNLTNTSVNNNLNDLSEEKIDKINKTKKVDSIVTEVIVSRNNSYRIKKEDISNQNLSQTVKKEDDNNNNNKNKKKSNLKKISNNINEIIKKNEDDNIGNINLENNEKFKFNFENFFTKNQIENMIEDSVKYTLNQTDIKLNIFKNKINEILKNSEKNNLILETADSTYRENKFILKNVKNFEGIIKTNFKKEESPIILLKEKIIKNNNTNLNINNYNYLTNNNSLDKLPLNKRINSSLPNNYSNYNDKIKKLRKNNSYIKTNGIKIEKLKMPKIN